MSSAREMNKEKSRPWEQDNFNRGMVKNAPHCDIPINSLALLRNAHAHPTECQPRSGKYPWSNIQPPVLEIRSGCLVTPRSGYTASKTGNIVTATQAIFTQTDVSNYIVFPSDEVNYHEEIQEYLSAYRVRVRDTGDRPETTGCWLHAKKNLWEFHSAQKRIVIQWGQDVYVADDLQMSSWTKAICISMDQPSNSISDWDEMDDYGVIFNSNGIYLVVFSAPYPVIFRKNTSVPTAIIEQNDQTDELVYRYDYTYSMSNLSNSGIRSRITPGTLIQQESGTCAIDENLSTPADYGSTWKSRRIDSGEKTQGRLVGETIGDSNLNPSAWDISDASFGITINDTLEYFEMRLLGESLSEVAENIESKLKSSFPFATMKYDADNRRFIVTSGEENGSTIGYMVAATSGTDISSMLKLRQSDGATIDNSYVFASPATTGLFFVPYNDVSLNEPEWHWTHYTIYRTADLGPLGLDPRSVDINIESDDNSSSKKNSPIDFTWVYDLRAAAAFLASRADDGLVTSVYGEFEVADVGSSLEWEDGEVDTISEYIDDKNIRVSTDYAGQAKSLQSAAIGGGRVIRASQNGNQVSIQSSSTLTSADIRKTIFWSDGSYSYIMGCDGMGGFTVNDVKDRPSQGITIDPTYRSFNDTVNDDTLRNRQGELHIGLLSHRFYLPMPNVNTGTIVPGFMITAIRDESMLYYCQLGASLKYLSGYHLDLRQTNDRIESGIRKIWKIPNKFIVFCNNSTWGGPTNLPSFRKLPKYFQPYTIAQVDIIDERIGVLDYGSIQKIDLGLLGMRCSDGSWRQFNGYKYSDDLSVDVQTGQDIIKKDMAECWDASESCYIEQTGYILWLRTKNGT